MLILERYKMGSLITDLYILIKYLLIFIIYVFIVTLIEYVVLQLNIDMYTRILITSIEIFITSIILANFFIELYRRANERIDEIKHG